MEELKKIFSDSRLVIGIIIFIVSLLIALLKWILFRILEHYDEKHQENKEDHKIFYEKLNYLNYKLSNIEGKLSKGGEDNEENKV